MAIHIPVLKKEVLNYLNPKENENFIDATIGEMGHSLGILERNKPNGKVLGIELDPEIIERDKEIIKEKRLERRIILVNDSYVHLKEIVERNNFQSVKGILFDLGISSWHLEQSERGFSFKNNEFLDMRFNPQENRVKAEEIINEWTEEELEKIFREYGEEKFSKRIAKKICQIRQKERIKTTLQLVEVVRKAIPVPFRRQKIHFATRVFQALRIAVNQELKNLEDVLPQALSVLEKGGKIVIISFHSLEDRIVKNFFKNKAKKGLLEILTNKPITASLEEIQINPRARSAKLRAAVKI